MIILHSTETRETEIRANESDFVELSTKLLENGATIVCEEGYYDVAPYSKILHSVTVRIVPGSFVELQVTEDDKLFVSGDTQKLAVLSSSIANFARDWVTGEHIHLDYYEGHPYLSEGSIPVVLTHL